MVLVNFGILLLLELEWTFCLGKCFDGAEKLPGALEKDSLEKPGGAFHGSNAGVSGG